MGLANILRVLQRHLVVSTLVLGLTFAAAAAFYVLTPTQYEASATFVMFPGATPTDQLFLNHPEYANLNSDNPYLNGGDVATATAVLLQTMQSDDVRRQLVAKGADPNYVVAIDNSLLSGGQMIVITGTGTSEAMAENTAKVVGTYLPQRLEYMQNRNGAVSPFLITAEQTLYPDQAIAKTSGKLRSVVVIVVGGFALLFGALTVLEAMAAARAERAPSRRNHSRRGGRGRTAGPAGPAVTTLPTPVTDATSVVSVPAVSTTSSPSTTLIPSTTSAAPTTSAVPRAASHPAAPVTPAVLAAPPAHAMESASTTPLPVLPTAPPAARAFGAALGGDTAAARSTAGARRAPVGKAPVRPRQTGHPVAPNGRRRSLS